MIWSLKSMSLTSAIALLLNLCFGVNLSVAIVAAVYIPKL